MLINQDEPSEMEYREHYDFFQNTYKLARFFTDNLDRKNLSLKENNAQLMFSKIVYDIDAFNKILPNLDEECILNITTTFSISRLILEGCCNLFHVCLEEGISECESEFRIALYEYHGEKQRRRIAEKIRSEKLDSMKTKDELLEFEGLRKDMDIMIEGLKKKVTDSSFYKDKILNLAASDEEKIKKGKLCTYLNTEKILLRLSENFEQAYSIYMQNSSHVHTHKYSLDQISRQWDSLVYSLENFTLMIQFTSSIFISIMKPYLSLFEKRLPKLSAEDYSILNLRTMPGRKLS